MSWRRWLAFGVLVPLVAAAGLRLALPELIRAAVVARVHAITGRAATLDAVDVALLQGRVSLRGFRLADRTSEREPFAELNRLDIHLRPLALFRGHLWLREVVLSEPTVRVIRYPGNDFNLSDLVQSGQSGETYRIFDVTVDRFVVVNGTTTIEDRALPEPRTWRSEAIAIEAHDLSSRPKYGTAVATSVIAGAPVSMRTERLRLYPIDLDATVTIDGFDLAMGRVYLPAGTPVRVDAGRGSTSLRLSLDASEGLRLDATARVEGVVLTRRDGGALARVPALTAALDGLRFGPRGMAVGRLALDASGAVIDPAAGSADRFAPTTLHARVSDLTWPIDRPAGLDLSTRVQGRGSLTVTGALHPPTAPSQLRVRLEDVDLAPWARFSPLVQRLTGVAQGDIRIDEPLRVGVPSRVRGTVAVENAGVWEDSARLLGAQRIEASELELGWPDRLRIGRLTIREPRAVVERDRKGEVAIGRLFGSPAGPDSSPSAPVPAGADPALRGPALAVHVDQVLVQNGTAEWRDEAAGPPVRAVLSSIAATVTGVGWPIAGPLELRLAGRPTGGGELQLAGRLGVAPLSADMHVTARAVDLAPYESYLGTPARFRAWTDLDLAVAMPSPNAPVTVRGRAALANVEVRDGERTVFQVERAVATGLEVEWPRRVAAAQLALEAPWLLVERDQRGAMAMWALLPTGASGTTAPGGSSEKAQPSQTLAVTVGVLSVEQGGARIVDQSVAPPAALDLRRLALRVEGLSTPPGPRAQVDLKGQTASGAVLALRGTVGPLGGPLEFDLAGDLGGFDAARANPYVVRYLAWQAAQGSVTARVEGRVRDDALDARVDVQLSRLEVVRAAPSEATGAGAGLPLNLVVALMRDSRGNINVSVPVSGRLGDPQFDFREAMRSAIRTVVINTITAPVSWIGRLHANPDSGIERVEVDPIRFQPASAALTADGGAQVNRVAAFLAQFGEVRMALAPVVSSRDLAALRHQAAEAGVDRLAASQRMSREAAAARLFRERLPDRPVPTEPGATLDALADTEASPAHALALAARRLETLRAAFQAAGIKPTRLVEAPPVERPDDVEGAIELSLVEPDRPQQSPVRKLLSGLGGTAAGLSE